MSKSAMQASSSASKTDYMPVERVAAFPVHPHAAKYQMIPEEKLDAMAADFKIPRNGKRTGQLSPIILRRVGKSYELIDGRNRLEACRRAGVMVRVIIMKMSDVEAIKSIVSFNDKRRQQTVRQQAEAAYAYWLAMSENPATKITQEEAAKEFGIALRTFQKWKPGGKEATESDAKKGNNNNQYPIHRYYRQSAYMLSELLLKAAPKTFDRADPRRLIAEIERLYKLEFPAG